MKFLIDRNELPYDAMVPDESLLLPVEEDDESEGYDEELHTDEVHGGGVAL